MTVVTELDLPFFNIFDPEVSEGLADETHRMIERGEWLARTPLAISVLDHEAVRDLLKDPRLHTMGTSILDLQGVSDGLLHEWTSRLLLNVEGPDHTRQRRVVSRAFTPRAVERLRPTMRTFVEQRAQAIASQGTADVVAALVDEYPIAVICELVGAPTQDWPRFSAWTSSIFKMVNFNLQEDLPEIEGAIRELEAYVEDLVDRKRAAPADDLLSTLLEVEEEGDRLSRQELVDLVSALLLAGTDTTRSQLGLGLLWFARNPQDWARLVADPSLVPGAVAELLRFDPTIAATPRLVVEGFEYRDVTFPTGTLLTLVLASANRDPSVVSCPMDFDVAADRGGWQPLTFGNGAHYCLGASLAKAELVEAFDVLARTWAAFELTDEPSMKPYVGIVGPTTLPMRVTPFEG